MQLRQEQKSLIRYDLQLKRNNVKQRSEDLRLRRKQKRLERYDLQLKQEKKKLKLKE